MRLEMLFSVVAALVVIFGAAVFATNDAEPTVTTVPTTVETTESVPVTLTTEIVDYDPETEMQYLYVQSQNIEKMRYDFEELNEIQQRMYDIAEDYDPVEYDFLQEQVDNERTIAKMERDYIPPLT
jgi:hypothetical protein